MKLSEVLDRYYVLPFGQSEFVGWYQSSQDDDPYIEPPLVVEWNDSDTGEHHSQEFRDQVIEKGQQGTFTVTTTDGETVAFIALTYVDLED